MSGFMGLTPVQVPDFGATLGRAQQYQQNQLLMAAQAAQVQNQAKYENALNDPRIMEAIQTGNLPALIDFARRGGPLAFQTVMPLLRQEREMAADQQAMGRIFGTGGAPAAADAPAAMPASAAMPAPAAVPAGPVNAPPDGQDVRTRNARFAEARRAILENPNLTPEQQQEALRRISAAQASAGGTPEIPGGYRANPGVGGAFAGLPAPTGTVNPVVPGPAGMAGRTGLPTLEQLAAMISSGRPRLVQQAQALAPLIAQANPNLQTVQVGGRVFLMNPRTGQRVDIGPQDDVRDETRTIDGRQVQGQVRNGVFTPFPRQNPDGYEPDPANPGGLRPLAGGPADQGRQSFDRANVLRDEFNKLTEDFRVVQRAHDTLVNASRDPSPAGDMSLLYQFNKLLDPNSVVRESEFAAAARTGSLDQRIGAYVTRLLNGERLTPEQRADIVKQGDLILGAQRRSYDRVVDQYRGIATRAGLPPEQVITDLTTPAPERGSTPAQAGSNRFSTMGPAELARVDVSRLNAAENQAYQKRIDDILRTGR